MIILRSRVFKNSVELWLQFMTAMETLLHIACPRLHTLSSLIPAIANGHCEHQPTILRIQEIQDQNGVDLILHSLLRRLRRLLETTHSLQTLSRQEAQTNNNLADLQILVDLLQYILRSAHQEECQYRCLINNCGTLHTEHAASYHRSRLKHTSQYRHSLM